MKAMQNDKSVRSNQGADKQEMVFADAIEKPPENGAI